MIAAYKTGNLDDFLKLRGIVAGQPERSAREIGEIAVSKWQPGKFGKFVETLPGAESNDRGVLND